MMGFRSNAVQHAAIVLGIAGALAISACTPTGRIGQMYKFDLSTASEADIAKALREDGKVAISAGILFETDSSKLTPQSDDVIQRLAQVMKDNPDLKVAVVGNTDNTGDFKYNLQLSERRAKAFADALVKDGVASSRVVAVGVGPLNPVSSNDTVEGRAENRRVDIVLIR